LVHFVILVTFIVSAYAFGHAAAEPGASAQVVQGFGQMIDSFGRPGTPAITQEVALYRSDYGAIFAASLKALPDKTTLLIYFTFD
ncbi:hypothetical protein, partial [Salmonella enterica]